VKLTPRLALGGSFNFWRGDWSEDMAASQTGLEPGSEPVFLHTAQDNRVRGNNYSLGLMLTYPRWSVGLVHQGPLSSDFTTTASALGSAAPPPKPVSLTGNLRFPRALAMGGAFRPSPRWTVALDLTWDDWTDAVLEEPSIGRVNFLDELPEDRTATKDTISLNAGAEPLFFGEGFVIPLRFGAAWEPQGARDPYTRDPVNFVLLAVGTGYNTNSLKFDAAFQYRWARYHSRASLALSPPHAELRMAVGERDSKEGRLKLSLILRIPDPDKLRHVFGKIF